MIKKVDKIKEIIYEEIRRLNRLIFSGTVAQKIRVDEKPRSPRRVRIGETKTCMKYTIGRLNDILGKIDANVLEGETDE